MHTNFFYLRQGKLQFFVFSFLAFFFLTPSYAQKKISYVQKKNNQPKSSFTAQLMNIEATSKQTFRFSTTLHNGSKGAQIYQLEALVPEGWITTFETEGSEVASVRIDSGKTQQISVQVIASPTVKPGKYNIPVVAFSDTDTLRLSLEAVVKGIYKVEITTPTGLLSDNVTEGSDKVLQLIVKNTGTLPLDGLQLTSEAPVKWTVTFDPAKLDRLDPGKTQNVKATVNVPEKTIAGDYVTTLTVKNNYVNEDTTFRLTVETSLLSGWIGMLIILLALAIVYYLIRKYGRR